MKDLMTTRDSTTAPTSISCPLCHAARTGGGGGADGWWRCTRCAQAWTDARLATVHAYAEGARGRADLVMAAGRAGPRLVRARA